VAQLLVIDGRAHCREVPGSANLGLIRALIELHLARIPVQFRASLFLEIR